MKTPEHPRLRTLLWLVAASLALGGAVRVPHQDARPPAPEYSTLVTTYCVTCHNERLKTAGLSLQTLDLADVPAHGEVWEKVARKLRSGEMPPSTVRARPGGIGGDSERKPEFPAVPGAITTPAATSGSRPRPSAAK